MAATEAAARRSPWQTSWSLASSLLHEFSSASLNWLVFSSVSSIEMMAFYSMPVQAMPSSTGSLAFSELSLEIKNKLTLALIQPDNVPQCILMSPHQIIDKTRTAWYISIRAQGIDLILPLLRPREFLYRRHPVFKMKNNNQIRESKNARWLIREIKLLHSS